MPRTREQLALAAADAAQWLDEMDPAALGDPAADSTDLRRIGLALAAAAAAETELETAVSMARATGRSWGDIAMVLGTSRQAARQRYGQPAIPNQR